MLAIGDVEQLDRRDRADVPLQEMLVERAPFEGAGMPGMAEPMR